MVADQHKLIPSVHTEIHVERDGVGNKGAVGYSGPTCTAIRSGTLESFTAMSHDLDFATLVDMKAFDLTSLDVELIDWLTSFCYIC